MKPEAGQWWETEFLRLCKKLFECDQDRGVLIWKVNRGKARKGAVVGHHDVDTGYITTRINGKKQYVHRLIWALHNGKMPEYEIDHINRNRKDNRICNLRHVDNSGQAINSGLSSRNRSGVKGVHWSESKRRWVVQIKTGRRRINGGSFESMNAAISARNKLESIYHRIEVKR